MTATAQPLARELAAYNEEELDRYLEENGRIVSVQDPENISPEFIQRLRDILHRERQLNKSHVVDLDQVANRLQAVPADREPFSRSPSLATTASWSEPQEEIDRENLQKEEQAYHEIVNTGGRPPYPLHLLEEFFWHPEQSLEHGTHRDIIQFYRSDPDFPARITGYCDRHLDRWTHFRRVQRMIRDRKFRSKFTLMDEFAMDRERYGPEEGEWGFPEYVQSVSRRLAKYGFTRPFQPDRDLNRQDKLTTWIEYLGFEYWFYDEAASSVKRLQRRHDDAWTKMLESNVLASDETYEVICDPETRFRYASEEERAKANLDTAAAAMLSSERALEKSSPPSEALQKRLLTDQRTLSAARERLEKVRIRNDAIAAFLEKTADYDFVKRTADRHSCLLRWIEQQIPFIELELDPINSAKDDSEGTDVDKALEHAPTAERSRAQLRKRRRPEGNTSMSPSPSQDISKGRSYRLIEDGRAPKRLKISGQSDVSHSSKSGASGSTPSALASGSKAILELKDGSDHPNETVEVSKPLRRSARIAAKRKSRAMTAPVSPAASLTAPSKAQIRSEMTGTKKSRPRKDVTRRIANSRRVSKRGHSDAPQKSTTGGGRASTRRSR